MAQLRPSNVACHVSVCSVFPHSKRARMCNCYFQEIFSHILDRQLTWPEDEDVSPECKDLVDRLLQLDPCVRFGHRGAGEIKLHPWFKDLDWTSLARTKAAFIPAVESETDTSYFFDKPVGKSVIQTLYDCAHRLMTRSTSFSDSCSLLVHFKPQHASYHSPSLCQQVCITLQCIVCLNVWRLRLLGNLDFHHHTVVQFAAAQVHVGIILHGGMA